MSDEEKKGYEEAIDKVDRFVNTITVILPKYSTAIPEYCIDEESWLAIKKLLTAYEKEKEERERIGKLYYEANENCIKYEKIIEKQQKEIEELKEKNRQGKMRIVQLENEITARIEDVNQYYTPNDKIKAKIEEYDDKGMTVNLANRSAGKTFQQAVHYEVKKVLQSLLEKE